MAESDLIVTTGIYHIGYECGPRKLSLQAGDQILPCPEHGHLWLVAMTDEEFTKLTEEMGQRDAWMKGDSQ